ncbi:hypothetical protein MATL_G00037530 [Megalops atlanticus]|uniref:PLA2c domain-containing protein n=1 Tax=Megalops atlanticus TaxID=7932 RepID=A0A9D3QI03_MEGAT|nr:hypothetical protein MATL_G00037530 [Megalops atlanticus]
MVGLLGSLYQMGEENLLDCALYLCGVSGSTWCMAALDEDPEWSSRLPSVKDALTRRLTETKLSRKAVLERLSKAINNENYSLTDFWAATIVYAYVREMNDRCLSEQRPPSSTNPYPIYAVVDQGFHDGKQIAACCMDIDPYEAGYTHLGAFADTSVFGSQFEGGELKKRIQEMDMLYLQGVCGSAFAEMELLKQYICQWIKDHLCPKSVNVFLEEDEQVPCDCKGCQVLLILLKLVESEDGSCSLLQELRTLLAEAGSPDLPKMEVIEENVWLKASTEQRQAVIKQHVIDICLSLQSWSGDMCQTAKIIRKTLPLFLHWTWGTTYNFLYKYPAGEGKIPPELLSDEKRYLEDAGFQLLSPYASAVRPARKTDLILSFDFCNPTPFMSLEQAAAYCKAAGIPFPKVEVTDDPNKPKDFYVFEGEGQAPTVIHIPLFNIVNCEGDVEKWTEKLTILQRPFSKDKVNDLLRLSSLNVKNNKKRILEEIEKVTKRKNPNSASL